MADEALLMQLRQRGELWLDRPFARLVDLSHDPEIDDVDRLDAQITQVVVDRTDEVVRRESGKPRCVGAANRADFGHDGEPGPIGTQRLGDDLVGDVGPVEVAGIDLVDATFDGLPQDRDRFGAIFRRAEHAGAGKLHGAVAHAMDDPVAEAKRAGGGSDGGHDRSPCLTMAEI